MFRSIEIIPKILKQNPSKIYYGLLETQEYGKLFLASYILENNNLYICFLHVVVNGQTQATLTNVLKSYWPESECIYNNTFTKDVYESYFIKPQENLEIYIALNGTDFQNKVWLALMDTPYGENITCSKIAVKIGDPNAAKAVGKAVLANNIAILLPCHRVKPKRGDLFKYRWGSALKKKLLLKEKMAKLAEKNFYI